MMHPSPESVADAAERVGNLSGNSKGVFARMAEATAKAAGKSVTFMTAFGIVVIWGITGPVFDYSDTWQLVINTGTTIVTFLMVFLIQNTQNRDTKAMQIKLDELIRVTDGAHKSLIDLEEMDDKELAKIALQYELVAKKARDAIRSGGEDTHIIDVDTGAQKRG